MNSSTASLCRDSTYSDDEARTTSSAIKIAATAILIVIVYLAIVAFSFVSVFASDGGYNGNCETDNGRHNGQYAGYAVCEAIEAADKSADKSAEADETADIADIEPLPIIEAKIGLPEDAAILNIEALWLHGEILHIVVFNTINEDVQTIELRLGDYVGNTEFVNIQAVDVDGNRSNVVQMRNPFYQPIIPIEIIDQGGAGEIGGDESNETGEADQTAETNNSFTPDGQGYVLDNITNANEIEFFTINTPQNNVFFMVIDRQRGTDNVYLLNAVTEADLMALAEASTPTVSGIPAQPTPEPTPTPEPEPTPEPIREAPPSGGNGNLIIIIIAIIGAAIFGFLRLRKLRSNNGDFDDEDVDEGEHGGEESGDDREFPFDGFDDEDGENAEDSQGEAYGGDSNDDSDVEYYVEDDFDENPDLDDDLTPTHD